MSEATPQRIAALTLDERTVLAHSAAIEHERATAITDLLKDNRFSPVSGCAGPFNLHLAVKENRLLMEIEATGDGSSETLPRAARQRCSRACATVNRRPGRVAESPSSGTRFRIPC